MRAALGTATFVIVVANLAAAALSGGGQVDGAVEGLGPLGHALAPLRQWDAGYFLGVAENGYDSSAEHAFFPLYPLAVWALGGLGASASAELLAAFALAFAGFAAGLVVFRRLAELEAGPRVARVAVVLLAAWPAAMFFVAPYSEGVFLALSVGAFYAARTGRWAWAGVLGAAAAATRNTGVVLLVPLALLWLYGPRPQGRERRATDALWLALVPAGLVAYMVHLGASEGDALGFLSAQSQWERTFWGPFGGVLAALLAAVDAVRELLPGGPVIDRALLERNEASATFAALQNLYLLGFLALAAVAVVGAFRRLPVAYGAYALAALALPLSYPEKLQPLMSLPRFMAVLFPLFLWLAIEVDRRRAAPVAYAVSAAGLAAFTAAFATGRFVG